MRPVWVGSAAERIGRLHGGHVTPAGSAAAPTFLAEHPRLPRLYAVDERDPGRVAAFAVGPEGALTRTGVAEIGGAGPCHVTVHPDGGWLYAACYGDGVVSALALDVHGDLTGDPVVLPHHGRGPHPDRQQGPHAHSTWVSPGGGWLVAADLGTDQLRAYRLDGGRPGGEPVLSDLPAGSGPRHAAVVGDRVHVACELSCEVVTLAWDEPSGRAEVLGAVTVVTLPPRTGTEHTLSHIEPLDARTLVVGVRGADSLAVVGLTDGVADRLLQEVLTVAWPRHLTVVDGAVLVAGERADAIGVHPLGTRLGELAETIATPAPMCLLPAR